MIFFQPSGFVVTSQKPWERIKSSSFLSDLDGVKYNAAQKKEKNVLK